MTKFIIPKMSVGVCKLIDMEIPEIASMFQDSEFTRNI